MSDLPDPLVPSDCDMRGLQFMPLDVVRLMDSDIFALSTGDQFKAAVALWCKAWLQVPAGSIPNDDRVLAHLSGAGARWGKLRAVALRGFIECSDGRLYHPVVCEKAREAWEFRLRQRERSAKGNAKRWGRQETSFNDPHGDAVGDNSSIPQEIPGGIARDRDRDRDSISIASQSHPKRVSGADSATAKRFYEAYPKHVDPRAAEKKFISLVKSGADPEGIIAAAARFAESHRLAGTDKQFIPAPAVWLNRGGFESEDLPHMPRAGPPPQGRGSPLTDAIRNVLERHGEKASADQGDTGNFDDVRMLQLVR